MDRRRSRAHQLSAIAALLLLGAGDAPKVPIREARWLAPAALFEGLDHALEDHADDALDVPLGEVRVLLGELGDQF